MLHILCYHRVLKARDADNWPYFERGTAVTAEVFDAQMREISARFEVLCEEEVIGCLRGERELSKPGCWVTFDDGYADNLCVAAPIVAKYGIRPSLFVTTRVLTHGWRLPVDAWYSALTGATRRKGRLGGFGCETWDFDLDDPQHTSRFIAGPEKRAYVNAREGLQAQLLGVLEEVLEPVASNAQPYLSASDLCELEEEGWSIGAHSRTHQNLTFVDDETLNEEVLGSLEDLRQTRLKCPSRFFAYPDGAWDPVLAGFMRDIAQDCGWAGALTIDPGIAVPGCSTFSLPRSMPSNGVGVGL